MLIKWRQPAGAIRYECRVSSQMFDSTSDLFGMSFGLPRCPYPEPCVGRSIHSERLQRFHMILPNTELYVTWALLRKEAALCMAVMYTFSTGKRNSELHGRLLRFQIFPEAVAPQLHTLTWGCIGRRTIVQEACIHACCSRCVKPKRRCTPNLGRYLTSMYEGRSPWTSTTILSACQTKPLSIV